FLVDCGSANGNHVTENLDSQLAEKQLGQGADGNPCRRFPGRGTLQYVARFGKVVLQSARQISVTGARRFHRFMLYRVAFCDWKRFLPVLPVFVFKQDGDRRTDGDAVVHAGKNMGSVRLNLHPPTTTVALLSPPQVAIDEFLVDFQAGWQTRQECDQSFAMGLAGGEVAQHKRSILN